MRNLFIMMCLISLVAGSTQAAERNATRVPRLLKSIDVKNWGSEQIRIGDLDCDGAPDLVVVQSEYLTRQITCLTAVTIDGKVLWQSGEPSLDNGRIYSDLPVQIYDWDNDGENEVMYIKQASYLDKWDRRRTRQRSSKYEGNAKMVMLDGQTGKEKMSIPIPAPADDSFLFADLTGKGRKEDLVVKDRYWNAWGVSHEGDVLWQFTGSVGHFPAVSDLDGDGTDETFFGYTLVGSDGAVKWSIDPNPPSAPTVKSESGGKITWTYDLSANKGKYSGKTPLHSDANYLYRQANGEWRLFFGNSGPHAMTLDGKQLWADETLGEAQHVVVGRFQENSEYQIAIIDRTPKATDKKDRANAVANYYLFDPNGNHLWKRATDPGDWMIGCTSCNWFGAGNLEGILFYGRTQGKPAQLLDGKGDVIAEFAMRYDSDRGPNDVSNSDGCDYRNFYPLTADVWGDSRDEVILFGARGLCIYYNPSLQPIMTLYNESLYPGM